MANKMLINSTHPEETRVVVVRGSRVEEFDFEAASKKQLRGNIYLAKVTRVEPSLQAAFVDYGGNRHGFLAFSEIHPDYYQIPVADRQALLEEEARIQAEQDRHEERASRQTSSMTASSDDSDPEAHGDDGEDVEDAVEMVGSEDALEELPERRQGPKLKRHYKIQEVIKRRQVLLVQVVKEERGNKGAALTTYLSLAGRYSVLMPNTARGGGISRKITNAPDRKRLKKIAQELEVPEGMGVIVRTAGAARTKAEIKRDFEYLLRLWENVRELTLKSTAPKLVYEEGSLIKRSIRDLYNKDIDEILVSGDDGYREAKDFMRMLMPSHAKNVHPYKEPSPVFTRFGVESQLDAMFSPQVTLRSGGYIVINQTEALVSIDVNSGKSTREHNIEDTALQTNLEAAEEVSRQLRLRDLAGLVVIDFIDMEEKRNNRSVERKLKDCLKNDRARIQVGRISHFGLMEMSRQRIRTGVLESSMVVCSHCGGTGLVRSTESVALHVLRSLEESLIRGVTHDLIVRTRTSVCLYILNQKRAHLADLERRFGLMVTVFADDHASMGGHLFVVEKGEPVIPRLVAQIPIVAPPMQAEIEDTVPDIEDLEEVEEEFEAEAEPRPRQGGRREEARAERQERPEQRAEGDLGGGRRKRRRRRRGRGRPGEEGHRPQDGEQPYLDGADFHTAIAVGGENGFDDGFDEGDENGIEELGGEDRVDARPPRADGERPHDGQRKRRRRGRRGGRRGRRDDEMVRIPGDESGFVPPFELSQSPIEIESASVGDMVEVFDAGATVPASVGAEVSVGEIVAGEVVATDVAASEMAEPADGKKKPKPRVRKPTKAALAKAAAAEAAAAASVESGVEAAPPESDVPPPPVAAAPAKRTSSRSAAAKAAAAAPVLEPQPAPAPLSEPAPPAEPEMAPPPKPMPASTELDPSKPKRSGWWAKKTDA